MPTYEHTLEGVFEHKLDPKCRVSVPSDWRVLAGSGVLRLLKAEKYDQPILKVYTEGEFESVLGEIDSRAEWTPKQRALMRGKLFSRCIKVTMNPQGKLLIPKALCNHPGVEPDGPAMLVGRGTYFEIVSAENYSEMCAREDAETLALNEEMDIF
ncbi:division/cell wall cluster transcriptional repressor MraZ [Rubritalea marina]|uniref:division/cell wall cluster transcriptional repressor MraZ n=1 Tax=Rubritalea marina TaxID=361055 RepID=UPI0012E9F8F0|nr:hypothetical protein [Rubritalea marina]